MNEIQRINEANCSEANRLREKFGLDLLTWWFLEDYGVSAGKSGRQERGSGPTMEAAVNEAMAKMGGAERAIEFTEISTQIIGAEKLSKPPSWWRLDKWVARWVSKFTS
jgi:hypothetical protein